MERGYVTATPLGATIRKDGQSTVVRLLMPANSCGEQVQARVIQNNFQSPGVQSIQTPTSSGSSSGPVSLTSQMTPTLQGSVQVSTRIFTEPEVD